MKHFLVATNRDKDVDLKLTHLIQDYLERHGADIFVVPDVYQKGINSNSLPDNIECAIALGGDGTILQMSRGLRGSDIPVLGVNLGNLGFLAEIDVNETEHMLDCLLKDDYRIENRMMLQGQVMHRGQVSGQEFALNDVVIGRSGFSRIISMNVYVNGHLLDNYHADGIIIATPTGSTGYNLSAGGPIINPVSKMIVVTPICAHAIQSRSIILDKDDKISIEVQRVRKTQLEEAFATFDGQKGIQLSPEDVVNIEMAPQFTKLIKITDHSFYDILKRKIGKIR
ncbi:MAG: NAD(+)/NADH kinase [Lachnospiraceae bacterium]|nr:NAD(+)/NADH kinase [Lachnospiraceae bacterium]